MVMPVDQTIPARLGACIAHDYGLRTRDVSPVAPSDEAVVWRAEGERPLLIHQSPMWRTSAELTWIHQLITLVARTVPESVVPLPTRSGATFVEHDGTLVTVYPFVDGVHLDRENAAQREAAARLLARVHRALLACDKPPRPEAGPHSPWAAATLRLVPPQLEDPELSDWHAALRQRGDLQRGLIHGDYYRRNLLWSDERIVAVVDWHEARQDLLLAEVAGATWELSKGPASRGFDVDRAQAFLNAYASAGGPADVADRSLIVPLIRWRLREEALLSLALEARGQPTDLAYREAVTASFMSLRSRSL